jgi:AsmA protein
MPSSTLRRSIWVLAAATVLAAAALAIIPYVASTRIVRDRIAAEIGTWSGYRVEIGAPPELVIWPQLHAVLTDITFSDPASASGNPVGTVERMEIELAPLAAMRGDAVFTSATLVRPTLAVGTDGDPLTVFAGKGRIRAAVERTRATLAEKGPAAARADLPDDAFGSLRIVQGRIVGPDGGAAEPLATGIEGSIDWPAFDEAGSLALRGSWRGEAVRLELGSANPLLLMAGAAAPLRVSASAAPASASFDGTATLAAIPFLNGRISLSAGSFDRLANWLGTDNPDWENLRAFSLSGAVSSDDRRIKLEEASLQVNEARATGAVELVLRSGGPAVSGSLAFDSVGFDQVLKALLPLTGSRPEPDGAPAGDHLLLDMRLSADRAAMGGLQMAEVAAAIQARKGSVALDILDARSLGGEFRAGMRFTRQAAGIGAEMTLTASNVDGRAFGAAAGMTQLVPSGRGAVSLTLRGEGSDARSALQSGSGSFAARFGAGTLSRFDLTTFLELCRKGGFFSLAETANGELQIDGLDLGAEIVAGVARIDEAEARFGDRRLWISGLASYADLGLALTGGIGPLRPPAPPNPLPDEAGFFVGGSWAAPLISPTAPAGN